MVCTALQLNAAEHEISNHFRENCDGNKTVKCGRDIRAKI